MKRSVTILLLFLLGGCQSLVSDDPDSPYYAIPAGSTLRLNESLQLADDTVSLFIQDGSVVADSSLLRRYYPYCKFEMWSRLPEGRTIEPDLFTIKKVVKSERYVAIPRQPVRLAGPWFAGIDRGGPTALIETTTLYLSSERQPDVYRIACEQWNEPSDSRPTTVPEMRRAMGGLFELRLGR